MLSRRPLIGMLYEPFAVSVKVIFSLGCTPCLFKWLQHAALWLSVMALSPLLMGSTSAHQTRRRSVWHE